MPKIYPAKTRTQIIDRLAKGESLSQICTDADMPCRYTVQGWQDADEDFNLAVTRAREIGYELRADRAVMEAKTADDASKGRLAFDAERWYLGKLSNAFSDNKVRKQEIALDMPQEVAEWLGLQS